MTRKNRSLTLEELTNKYENVLFDTSTILGTSGSIGCDTIDMRAINKEPTKVIDRIKSQTGFYLNLLNSIDSRGKIIFTSGVLGELSQHKILPYKKFIKLLSSRGITISPQQLLAMRLLKQYDNFRLRSLMGFSKVKLSLNPEQKDIYDCEYESHLDLRTKFDLSEVDFDLLISGCVLSRSKSVAVVSTDRGIRKAWNFYLDRVKMSHKKYGLYSRNGQDEYRSLRLFDNYLSNSHLLRS